MIPIGPSTNANIEPLTKKFKQESDYPSEIRVGLGPVINEKKLAAVANSQFMLNSYPFNNGALSTT